MDNGARNFNKREFNVTGLAMVGLLLNKTQLKARLNEIRPKGSSKAQIKNGDIASAYIGLLCQGKNDFDTIREMEADPEFYKIAFDLDDIPSRETLRQRMDRAGASWRRIILEENMRLLSTLPARLTPCLGTNYLPLDISLSSFNNSNTKREGIFEIFEGFSGYAPLFVYLGNEGYLINTVLNGGTEQFEMDLIPFIRENILQAKRLTSIPVLLRLGPENDSEDILSICYDPQSKCDFIIERNLRGESIEEWLKLARAEGVKHRNGQGEVVYTGSVYQEISRLGCNIRIVYEVIERNSTNDGQLLLIPDITVNTWWASLEKPEKVIIDSYQAYRECDQHIKELKTDMGLERLPSGKLETNQLVLELAMIAYNILLLIGTQNLKHSDVSQGQQLQRRRLRTIMQNLVTTVSGVSYPR